MANIHPLSSEDPATPGSAGRGAAPPPGPNDLIDWGAVLEWVRFARASLRRRRLAAALALLGCLALAGLSLWAMPKAYRCEVQILADQNLVMPNLGNPRRSVPRDADAPTKGARQFIMRREGLLAIVKQTDLLKRWDDSRPPVGRVIDFARKIGMRLTGKTLTEEDRIEAMLGILEERVFVTTQEPFIEIAVVWPDAESAFLVASAATQDFLAERHAREIAAIAETISVLESQAEEVRENVNAALGELRRIRPPGDRERPAPRIVLPERRQRGGRREPAAVAEVRTLILAKRRAIEEIEQFRARRMAELQTQLAEQRATYGPAHPVLVATQNSIAALEGDSPQLAGLKREEADLAAEFERLTGRSFEDVVPSPASSAAAPPAVVVTQAPEAPLGGDEAEVLRSHVKMRTSEYEDLVQRIDSARLELDTTRAGFKHRYAVLQPGKIPKKPMKPKASVTLAMGGFAGFVLAMLVPLSLELWTGRRPRVPYRPEHRGPAAG